MDRTRIETEITSLCCGGYPAEGTDLINEDGKYSGWCGRCKEWSEFEEEEDE